MVNITLDRRLKIEHLTINEGGTYCVLLNI